MDGESVIETVQADAADPADRSLLDDLRLLAGDARTLAEAEFAYQKSRAQVFGSGIGKILGLAVGALLLVGLALVGLTVGLIIALTPSITAWGATAVVVGVLIVLAGTAALWAKSLWTRLTDLVA
ncbi:MAG: phage holin family protein [Novosphingobium sp.]